MPDPKHPQAGPAPEPPTARQQRYLRVLAQQRGQTFVPPETKAQASKEIDRLKAIVPEARSEVRREQRTVLRDIAASGGSARVRDGEVVGYGATATWGAQR